MRFATLFDWLCRVLLVALLLAGAAAVLFVAGRRSPEDLPWTPLDLGAPIGTATEARLAGLAGDGPRCEALLARAGVRYTPLAAREGGPSCGYGDAVRLEAGGARGLRLMPGAPPMSCAVAAALAMWEWQVVQPAALRHFGQPAARIDHFGVYSCRRIYGRSEGAAWSEHASARAIDIAGIRLADGTRITVAGDWRRADARAAFLHEIRDGACRLFATTLSPDYNRAHHDHLHLDMAARGTRGWGVCR